MVKRFLLFVAGCSLVLLFNSLATAADSKAMVKEINETKEAIKRYVKSEKWTEADSAIISLEKQMKEFVAEQQLSNADNYNKKTSTIVEGIRKEIAEEARKSQRKL